MEPHDSHELALNRAFEERWQRRMERPRSVAALTALQYRERKKYELAWYKNETIQLSEQIEHLQNRLSFLMDQNTSLNLECQKLRKRVAQLENLCRDQLKNLVSRPSSKLSMSNSGTNESPSSSLVSGGVVVSEATKNDVLSTERMKDIDVDESESSSPVVPTGDDISESTRLHTARKQGTSTLASTTATVRRGIPIVKQRSPSGKTTIVAAAASTSGTLRSTSKNSSRNVSYVALPSNKESTVIRATSPNQNTSEHDYLPRKRILIPKRALTASSSEGNKTQTLRVMRPIGSLSSKTISGVNQDTSGISVSYSEQRSLSNKASGLGHTVSSKRLSANSFSKNIRSDFERNRKDVSASPVKTPPEVFISDAESSDVEVHDRLPKSQRCVQSLAVREKQSSKVSNPKRPHLPDGKPAYHGKRAKSSELSSNS